jgi:hypothetical protein
MLDSGGGFVITWFCLPEISYVICRTISFRLPIVTLGLEASNLHTQSIHHLGPNRTI